MNINSDHLITFIKENPVRDFSEEPLTIDFSGEYRFVRFSLQEENSFHLDTIEIYNKDLESIEKNKEVIISSCYDNNLVYSGRNVIKGLKNGGCGFHTKREANPWLIIDLGSSNELRKINIFNRKGGYSSRASSLMVEVSNDLRGWDTIYDNWSVIKKYKDGDINQIEDALLNVAILKSEKLNDVIGRLKLANKEFAVKLMCVANEILKSKGLAFGPHGITKTFAISSEERKHIIYNELSDLLNLLNKEAELPAFISSGTLLGIVRDGCLIPHDDDVDICYISKKATEHEILKERKELIEFLASKGYKLKSSGIAHYWCTTPKGINLDIFTGFIEGQYCSLNPIGRKKVLTDDVFPLKIEEYNNVDLYLPRNPEPLLVLNYGDSWRTPDPLWSFDWGQARKNFSFLYFD